MKQTMFQEKYPVFFLEVSKEECRFGRFEDVVNYFEDCVKQHPKASYIATFDHYAHTDALEEGEISEDILAAKNVVFCFGLKLPNALVMAVRPRSFGITEYSDKYIVSFLEAPMPFANKAMEEWSRALRK
ncbi:DUF6858 family protein [Neptunomonas sp.]|uniref:DUF6858 family protein n=1 Tax=Neptunomonas sp. TaxID=1971898 RepID=UPI0025E2DD32|nr:hypothetical protein [Neptunomonas sp.]